MSSEKRDVHAAADEIPTELTQVILAGNCVAFVGAGFSAQVVPTWKDLLLRIAEKGGAEERARIGLLLESEPPRDIDFVAAAEMLRDALGAEQVVQELRSVLAKPRLDDAMKRRLEWLRGIPFRAILTTNFDGLLRGQLPGGEVYASVLRPRGHRWSDGRFWGGGAAGPRVVKLHGDVTSVDPANHLVLSRRDYRKRLYSDTAYASFLRAVFATSTVLYLGYSFSDSYLNELRSEILALLEHRPDNRPIAYAIVNDVSEAEVGYFERHEAVRILPYQVRGGNFSGFDGYLETIYAQTNPQLHLGRLLSGRRILWVDPRRENNEAGMRFLMQVANGHERQCIIDTATSWEGAIGRLTEAGREADLVITHWGHGSAVDAGGRVCSTAERLLSEIRRQDLPVPVIVFADRDFADENRVAALKRGALAFVFRWETLFREIADVFERESDIG
jgi:hypothetical protein